MSEPIIRAAFTYGAGDAEPADTMWLHIRTAIAARRQRRLWWRRVAVAATAVLLVAGGGVAAVPGARAAVVETVKYWVTIWQGKVGQVDASLNWVDEQHWSEMEQQGWRKLDSPPTKFGSVAEAAGFLGFQPFESHLPGAAMSAVLARREPYGGRAEWRDATILYLVGKGTYRVFTSADFRLDAGTWAMHPYVRLDSLMVLPQPPSAPRKVDLGSTEAMCYQFPDPNPDTVCELLIAGKMGAVQGPDPETVIEMARSLLK